MALFGLGRFLFLWKFRRNPWRSFLEETPGGVVSGSDASLKYSIYKITCNWVLVTRHKHLNRQLRAIYSYIPFCFKKSENLTSDSVARIRSSMVAFFSNIFGVLFICTASALSFPSSKSSLVPFHWEKKIKTVSSKASNEKQKECQNLL